MPKLNFNNYSLKNNFWQELIGDRSTFSLESRIFHSISIGIVTLLAVYVPYNLFAGLYVASLSAFVIGLIFSFQYYYSRFQGKKHSNIVFGLIGVGILGFNYFSNSGIDGSTDVIWPAYLLLVFAITPYQQHLKWLIIYLLCFAVLHILEYQHPEWVSHPFTVGKGQFIDRITAFPIPVVGIYIIITFIRRSYDIERKVAEEKAKTVEISNAKILAQKDLLEQNNIEKTKLMSIISHDLRSPLTNIQNYLQLLNESVLNSEERSELEKALLNTTNNTMQMLSNLLHWSKSQMDGSFVNLVNVKLIEVLQSTLEMEKIHALKKEITLNYTIPNHLLVTVDVDMLQLVVRNLVSNAIKFTPQKGLITVKTEELTNSCKIIISDNGKGIPNEQQAHIFSIKSQPSLGTNNEKGVGLGLVLCKEFIEQQGGSIGFESKEGLGSNFFIILPISE